MWVAAMATLGSSLDHRNERVSDATGRVWLVMAVGLAAVILVAGAYGGATPTPEGSELNGGILATSLTS